MAWSGPFLFKSSDFPEVTNEACLAHQVSVAPCPTNPSVEKLGHLAHLKLAFKLPDLAAPAETRRRRRRPQTNMSRSTECHLAGFIACMLHSKPCRPQSAHTQPRSNDSRLEHTCESTCATDRHSKTLLNTCKGKRARTNMSNAHTCARPNKTAHQCSDAKRFRYPHAKPIPCLWSG